MDHYGSIGTFQVHEDQILISFAIMFITSCIAFGYIKVSVSRDFAILAGGNDPAQAFGNTLLNSSRSVDSEGRQVIGGLEIVPDASEFVGWQKIKGDVFRPPEEATILGVLLGVGA